MPYLSSRKAVLFFGLSANTLRSRAKEGKIDFVTTESGQRKYFISQTELDKHTAKPALEKKSICYCRVSSLHQSDDLERQVKFMKEKYPLNQIIQDVGSGINFKRTGLKTILDFAIRGLIKEVVVAHKDRLARIATELIRYIIEDVGKGKLVVLSEENISKEEELTEDLLAIMHSFSARMHGKRRYTTVENQKNKVKSDIEAEIDF